MESILLKNCRFVLTQNARREILENCDILIENGIISEIAKKIGEKCETIDCSGKLVMPALFNAHTHSPMTLLRGYNDDKELKEWLNDVWKIEALLSPKDMKAGALYSAMEMAKTGTYGFMDMYFEMEEVAEACRKTGLTSFLGYGMIDLFSKEKTEKEISRTKKFVDWVSGRYEGVFPVLAPHSIYTCSPEMLSWTVEYSKEKNIPITIHLSETMKEVEDCLESRKMSPVHYLESIGFLGKKTFLFHASFVGEDEARILSKRGSSVVNCPASNMKLATMGSFPMRLYERHGIHTLLGTDGACSNNSLDMFQEMKFSALLQKFSSGRATEATAQGALDMATVKPGYSLGINNGSIEAGKSADIAILDLNHHSMGPKNRLVSNIVYSATGDCVSDLIVRGKIVLKDRMLQNADEERIRNDFEESAEKIFGIS